MGIRDKIHRVVFAFNHQIRLRNYMMEPSKQAINTEIIHKLIRTSFPIPLNGNHLERDFPLAALNPDPIVRGDIVLCFTKTLASRTRSLWINIQAPHNVTQQDIDLDFSYRTGEGLAVYQEEDLRDWQTPIIDFYRDIVLIRLMPALFFGIQIEPRIR